MVIAILANEQQKQEFLSRKNNGQVEYVWADSLRSLGVIEADVYIDLEFSLDPERISRLKKLLARPVIVNSVTHTLREIAAPFIRVNAWPTMLGRPLMEMAISEPSQQEQIKNIEGEAGWSCQLVPDITGLVTPRIIAMIINEAWYTFGDGTSSREEIDTAMKLGTNYPYGPFEWGARIGYDHVMQLLKALSRTDSRYTIAPALLNRS